MYSFAAGSSGLLLNTLIGNCLSLVLLLILHILTWVLILFREPDLFSRIFDFPFIFSVANRDYTNLRVNILRETRLHCIRKFSSCLKESNASPLQSLNC